VGHLELQELHEVDETPPPFADMFSGRLFIVGRPRGEDLALESCERG